AVAGRQIIVQTQSKGIDKLERIWNSASISASFHLLNWQVSRDVGHACSSEHGMFNLRPSVRCRAVACVSPLAATMLPGWHTRLVRIEVTAPTGGRPALVTQRVGITHQAGNFV